MRNRKLISVLIVAVLVGAPISSLFIHAAITVKADYSGTNLALIPPATFWTSVNAGGKSYGWSLNDGTNGDIYPVSWQGKTTIEMQPDSAYETMAFNSWGGICELDGYQGVSVGDVISWSVWIWTSASSTGDTSSNHGAVAGCDVYGYGGGYTGRIQEIDNVNGVGVPDYDGASYHYVNDGWVPWGSGAWVHKTMTLTVQPTYISDGFNGAVGSGTGGAPLGTVMTPTEICPWICTETSKGSNTGSGETGVAYIYDTEFYVNPSGSPPSTATPLPTSTPTPTSSPSNSASPSPVSIHSSSFSPPPSSITFTSTSLGQTFVESGFVLPISVTVHNSAGVSQVASVKLFANSTSIFNGTLSVDSSASRTLNCYVNTKSLLIGNYTISASVTPLGESNVAPSSVSAGTVGVTYVGDLNGDFRVNFADLCLFTAEYIDCSNRGTYNPALDFNHDGQINFNDLLLFETAYASYANQQP